MLRARATRIRKCAPSLVSYGSHPPAIRFHLLFALLRCEGTQEHAHDYRRVLLPLACLVSVQDVLSHEAPQQRPQGPRHDLGVALYHARSHPILEQCGRLAANHLFLFSMSRFEPWQGTSEGVDLGDVVCG